VTYGASGTLRQQVEGGAPIDLVVFASAEPVDKLIQENLVDPKSRHVVARNRLVLVGPRGGAPITFATLAALGPRDQLAIGEPTSVPAGAYAERALKTLGAWDVVRPKLVFGGDVTAALTYARRGEVRAAIVYATDVRGLGDVVVLDTLDEARSPRIEVVAGAVTASPRAHALLDFIRSDEGQRVFDSFGFQRPQ
jgi:molybdate transport system substrate-binding protein